MVNSVNEDPVDISINNDGLFVMGLDNQANKYKKTMKIQLSLCESWINY
ncbi:hypothetical protein DesyoDRAFT_1012 [Desulfosporosinus youngiae DSM 17734]|uniref:Uncharacterized protein n=1 Tax=Desulfosporosinus youngiae DSM 17734 TaxID=768710 RepID=H5XT77_9FIRM|nr:hypothetical protein DesyoDRAFT_1012 [Desulfosporosinus youngiae DSM 17734]